MLNLWQELHTERLLLRRICMEDADFIQKQFSDVEVSKYLVDNEPISTVEEAKDIIIWSHANEENPTNNRWLIVLKETDEPIGTIGFHRWDKNNRVAEIGYDLYKTYWRNGFMNEAMGAVLEFGFDRMELNRVQAFVHVENTASHRLLIKNGFCEEGIIRDMYLFRGKFHDHYILSFLFNDYKTNKIKHTYNNYKIEASLEDS